MTYLAPFRSVAARAFWIGLTIGSTVSCEVEFPHAPFPPNGPSVGSPTYAAFVRGRRDTLRVWAHSTTSVRADLSDLPPGHDATFSQVILEEYPGNLVYDLLWTPTESDTGFYHVSFTASGQTGAPDTTLIYTVGHAVDTDPVVTCPDTVYVTVGVPLTFSITAVDPDGDPLFLLARSFPAGSNYYQAINMLSWTWTVSGATASGTLEVRANEAGWFPIQFQAENAGHGFATTLVVARQGGGT